MSTLSEFTEWAITRGVKLNGITTRKFPGKGLGIVAEENLEAGDIILNIPTSALRTAQTVPRSISKHLGAISVQGLLAADFAMDTSTSRDSWRTVLPTKEDFKASIPLMWHSSLQTLLPSASLCILENQKIKSSSDWSTVSTAFPNLSYDHYLYNWFLVGTRTFYYDSPKQKSKKPLHRDDCLALIPLADCFNHTNGGCDVTFSPSGYQIRTDRKIDKGEEIFISYRNHGNDFLLTEYGFIMDDNEWDEMSLDEVILPLFSEEQRQTLKREGFLGKYVLDKKAACYRTQVALKLLCMLPNNWQRSVAYGFEDEDKFQAAINQILFEALNSYLSIAHERLKQLKVLDCGLLQQRNTLSRRWDQISLLLTTAISRIEI